MKSAVRRRMSLISGSKPGIGVTLIATAVSSSGVWGRASSSWPTGGPVGPSAGIQPWESSSAGPGGEVVDGHAVDRLGA